MGGERVSQVVEDKEVKPSCSPSGVCGLGVVLKVMNPFSSEFRPPCVQLFVQLHAFTCKVSHFDIFLFF